MPLTTRLTKRFALRHPIVLAPMDYVADVTLATAVARAGGLGLLGGGYGDREWLVQQFKELDAAGHPRMGCGFITWSMARQPELLDMVLERKPEAVFLSFADPAPFADRIKASGASLICQVGSVEHARRALDVGADVLAAQGTEAGGHGLVSRATFSLVPEVVDLVSSRGSDAMVLASGGVADGRGLAAALALGADGVVVGTRFWASAEAAVPPAAQRASLPLSGDDTIRQHVFDLVRAKDWPAGYTGRVIANDFVTSWHGREDELRGDLDTMTQRYRTALEEDDYDIANVTVGESIGLVHRVQLVDEIVTSMVNEAVSSLQGALA